MSRKFNRKRFVLSEIMSSTTTYSQKRRHSGTAPALLAPIDENAAADTFVPPNVYDKENATRDGPLLKSTRGRRKSSSLRTIQAAENTSDLNAVPAVLRTKKRKHRWNVDELSSDDEAVQPPEEVDTEGIGSKVEYAGRFKIPKGMLFKPMCSACDEDTDSPEEFAEEENVPDQQLEA
jgi:hypothetical protein